MIDCESRPLLVMSKTYCGESLPDIEQDIYEMLDAESNPVVKVIPKEDGIHSGTFEVTVLWIPDLK